MPSPKLVNFTQEMSAPAGPKLTKLTKLTTLTKADDCTASLSQAFQTDQTDRRLPLKCPGVPHDGELPERLLEQAATVVDQLHVETV